jgi:hypothetical protein
MTRTVQSVFIMIAIMLGILLAAPVNQASAAQSSSKSDGVTYSGVHRRNVHVKTDNGKVDIVKGTIFSVRGNTITMDGESFSIPSGKIHDQLGRSVQPEELYPGLKARLVIRNGYVESVTILNFFRGKAVTDPQQVEQIRQREMKRQRR